MSQADQNSPLISKERLQHVIDLASKIAQSETGIKINPPKMVADDPSLLGSEHIVERLMGTTWLMRLADGSEERLTLPELVVTLFNLFAIREQIDRGRRDGFWEKDVEFSLTFDVAKIMSPEMVRNILSRLQIVRPPAKSI